MIRNPEGGGKLLRIRVEESGSHPSRCCPASAHGVW
jgi:hypothetical protein